MLNIDEKRLKDFLEKNKSKIGFQKINVLPVIISFLSTLVTFMCKEDYPNTFVEVLMIVVVLCSLLYTVYVIVSSSIKKYNYTSLYYDIELLDDDKAHFFNIIVQKYNNKSGKYLTFFSSPWGCNLFPNYKSTAKYADTEPPTEFEIENICKLYKKDTGIHITKKDITYKGYLHDYKYSPNDKVNKHYVFRFFYIEKEPADNISDKGFEYAGKKYFWMTISDMQKNKKIMKNNKNVVDYVKSFTTLS